MESAINVQVDISKQILVNPCVTHALSVDIRILSEVASVRVVQLVLVHHLRVPQIVLLVRQGWLLPEVSVRTVSLAVINPNLVDHCVILVLPGIISRLQAKARVTFVLTEAVQMIRVRLHAQPVRLVIAL